MELDREHIYIIVQHKNNPHIHKWRLIKIVILPIW